MKVISYNVNGIRAALKKDFMDWLSFANPDIICFQESKAQKDQIDIDSFEKAGYYSYWHSAVKKGYSGVGIATKKKPNRIAFGCGMEDYDNEGRIIRADFDEFSVVSTYVPSASNMERLDFKLKFCDDLLDHILELQKKVPNLIISGDFNICHKETDIHDPVRLKSVSGFLPVEREWMTQFIEKCKLVDTFRFFNSQRDQYSWWSYRQNARAKNKGWRIDYHFVTQTLKKKLTRALILKEAMHSDHCPVLVELEE
ncbi:MAG: exodeoxyribonuclease III [Bergeyella sp.]|nr:exodeoxyribonuclease III [Bergeyella sp.]